MQVGFIGIGVMGRPMTLNLLKAEHHVTIYARHPEKPEVQEVINAGAKLAPSPRAVAMASDIVITMLSAKGKISKGSASITEVK
jgi:2-hydroxy-3-oxopropionate reductase/2-hydroxymethylglutarate dehydrogenase